MSEDEIQSMLNGLGVQYIAAQPDFWTDLEAMKRFENVLHSSHFQKLRSFTMPANYPAQEKEIVVYKNNSDGKGNSYGCHENYLVDRAVAFGALVRTLTPWFVTRQIFCGAGKVGSENGAARFTLAPGGGVATAVDVD